MIESLLTTLAAQAIGSAIGSRTRKRIRSQLSTLILKVLELQAKADGKLLSYPAGASGASSPDEMDALFPGGFQDWPGPIGVKIWIPNGGHNSLDALLERLARIAENAAAAGELKSILFVHNILLKEEDSRRLQKYIHSRRAGPELHVWGPHEVANLVEQYKDEIGDLLPELALVSLRTDLHGPEPDWREQSNSRLGRLTEIYQREGVVLALGAGVSIGMGVPNWDELVSALFVSLMTKQLTGDIDEPQALALADAARKVGNESPLLSARYLRRGFEDGNAGDPQAFQQALAAVLYHHISVTITASPLLRELAKLCMPQRTGPKVHSVITYNFDDLLEQVLSEEGVRYRSIYSARHHALETELPVYHVHGFLPRDVAQLDGAEEGLLAFSEEGYHQLFKDPYNWTNVIQLQSFQQQTCVLVGLSLTDPNLRRLLEYAATARDEPRHFAFMKRTSVGDLLAASPIGHGGMPLVDQNAAGDFLRVHHSLQERVYRELGLEIIWFDEYKNMPAAVAGIRSLCVRSWPAGRA